MSRINQNTLAGKVIAKSNQETKVDTKPQYLRFADLKRDYSLPQSTVYDLIKKHGFPKQIRLTRFTVVFRRADVEAWIAEREAEGVV